METIEKFAYQLGKAVLVGALFASVSAFLFGMSASLSLAQEEIDTFEESPAPEQQQPMMGSQELRDFLNQFSDVGRETKKLVGDLKGVTVDEANAWKQTLQNVQSQAASCVKRMKAAKDNEAKIEIRDECHSLNLWDEVNQIREQFVPPQEVKNAVRDIKRQMSEINSMLRKIKSLKLDKMQEPLNDLLNKLGAYHVSITKSFGADQREALQNYWDAQLWDQINGFNAQINIPNDLNRSKKDLERLEKKFSQSTYKKALEYFNFDIVDFVELAAAKKKVISTIEELLASGDAGGAQELMQENFYNPEGWHPGDLQGLLDMFRDMQQRMKRVKDEEVKAAIIELLEPIIDAMKEGDVRGARETMEQLTHELQKYEDQLFKAYPQGIGKKTRANLDNLQSLIEKKFGSLKDKETTKETEPMLLPTPEEKDQFEKQGPEEGSEIEMLKKQLNESMERNKNLEAQLQKLTEQLDKLLQQKSE
ncbi:hypothetical protein HY622_00075 [Candidatus Uhrbacteria bacterium]|nr:hypothetical protein [Candidatus Uhrbacteria bacterium]